MRKIVRSEKLRHSTCFENCLLVFVFCLSILKTGIEKPSNRMKGKIEKEEHALHKLIEMKQKGVLHSSC